MTSFTKRGLRRPLILAVVTAVGLSGCGRLAESRVNPFNWFGNDRAEQVEPLVDGLVDSPDRRPLVQDVTQLVAEPVTGGAIVRATGVPNTQGYFDAELVEVETDDPNVLTYEFRVIPPRETKPQGTQISREIVVGQFASTQKLQGVRTIRVLGSKTARSVRR